MPRGAKLTSSTLAHNTISLVNFIPDEFNLKMGNRASETQKQGTSESQSLTNTSARIMYIQKLILATTYLIGEIIQKEISI